MSLKKQVLKSKPVCKVTFKIPGELGKEAAAASIVGDFNEWDKNATPMKKLKKDGSFSVTLNLETGKEYQFRYVLDGEKWINEKEADRQVETEFADATNSVISL